MYLKNPKTTPKNENIYISNFYREYLVRLQSSASGTFLQTCINSVEQLRFSHFEGSIIPQNKLDNLLQSAGAYPESRQTPKVEYLIKEFTAKP